LSFARKRPQHAHLFLRPYPLGSGFQQATAGARVGRGILHAMNLPGRSVILGIIAFAAIVLAASLFFVIHKPQPSAPSPGVPGSADSLSTSTSQQSLQLAPTEPTSVRPQSPSTTTYAENTDNDNTSTQHSDMVQNDANTYIQAVQRIETNDAAIAFDYSPDQPYFYKDNRHVFDIKYEDNATGDMAIQSADPSTFKILSLMPSCDGNHGFSCTSLQFAKDNNHVYGKGTQVLSFLDPATFTVLNPSSDADYPNLDMKMYAKDKNGGTVIRSPSLIQTALRQHPSY
jgi:hypothetical protein